LMPGLATFEQDDGFVAPPKVFEKVVFMVIDALRRYDCTISGSGTITD
jgi:ethanolaminephosphotransferase